MPTRKIPNAGPPAAIDEHGNALSDLLRHSASEAERSAAEQHLASCRQCRNAIAQISATLAVSPAPFQPAPSLVGARSLSDVSSPTRGAHGLQPNAVSPEVHGIAVQRLLDPLTAPRQRLEASRHVAQCQDCRHELARREAERLAATALSSDRPLASEEVLWQDNVLLVRGRNHELAGQLLLLRWAADAERGLGEALSGVHGRLCRVGTSGTYEVTLAKDISWALACRVALAQEEDRFRLEAPLPLATLDVTDPAIVAALAEAGTAGTERDRHAALTALPGRLERRFGQHLLRLAAQRADEFAKAIGEAELYERVRKVLTQLGTQLQPPPLLRLAPESRGAMLGGGYMGTRGGLSLPTTDEEAAGGVTTGRLLRRTFHHPSIELRDSERTWEVRLKGQWWEVGEGEERAVELRLEFAPYPGNAPPFAGWVVALFDAPEGEEPWQLAVTAETERPDGSKQGLAVLGGLPHRSPPRQLCLQVLPRAESRSVTLEPAYGPELAVETSLPTEGGG